MRAAQHAIAVALVLCVAAAFYLSLREIALPGPAQIDSSVKESEPIQEGTDQRPFTVTIGGYTYSLTPRASYDISGLVVSQHRGDALLNLYHKADPGNIKDVCVVWGGNVINGSYRQVRFTSEEFTCYYAWSGVLRSPFDHEKMSNNHLIPATPDVAAEIRGIHVGDQVRMRGFLVDYSVSKDGHQIFTRRTSTTRKDTGNGACEILYTTDVLVLARGNHFAIDAVRYAWFASLGLFLALGIVWFARPHPA